ncbi:class I SAM-dependent methyltransferase [Oceanobacillus bengalensis]|uniref:Class I SAM-dependent methyltransferase n=1 Tax=Oceanobacillus bengalensis TaxID=1435466 RepID=A0A494Z520_9BACI|nr:class I SAM-dependent methyltransferase [Oceanobacillus bengalensis]RKQ17601.1 class I SAM-dependent methyltransferase [Oceanobacillus bengalensis]
MKEKLFQSNNEEYEDPILYDKENNAYNDDIPFLLKWSSKVDGTIIDLACGTGRATIPLAKGGHKLIGVDVHQGMLAEANRKSSDSQLKIAWVLQDCTKLHLNTKSRMIYSVGNSFQHFLTNETQDGLLQSVNRHLEEAGVFIFSTRFPSADELLQPSTEEYWRTYTDSETLLEVDLFTISKYDSLNQIQHNTTIRRYRRQSGEIIDEKRTNISLRYVFPKEMERILFANGFEIVHVYEDWKESPLKEDSNQMVYVCRKLTTI